MISERKQSEHTNHLESSQQKEPIVIVCAADDKYAMPLAAMSRSLLENVNRDRSVKFFIIDGGIRKNNKKKILKTLSARQCEVVFLPNPRSHFDQSFVNAVQYTVTEGNAKKHLSIPAYYRLLIAKLLPAELEKAIYLDCDLIINTDIEQLWMLELAEHHLLAVPDMWVSSVSAHNGLLNYRELGIDDKAKYFNSGVLVINIAKWRSDNLLEKATNYLKQNKEYIRFADQDILNALLAKQWSEIDPRWNVTPGIYEYSSWQESPFPEKVYDKLLHAPHIIHFAAAEKPWNCREALLQEHFFHYLDMTAWAGWRFTAWRQLQMKLAYKFKKLKSTIVDLGKKS